ncbi:hypothetical protein ACFV84_30470 [Kitasatospora sp. NPDC059811]|uniref:hypothetical protein n=1 Tax=Streptomycetaceae TaxID=2062 RepID=UPI0013315A30|nr:hypothetical protein [Streptomyces sp. MJM8645]
MEELLAVADPRDADRGVDLHVVDLGHARCLSGAFDSLRERGVPDGGARERVEARSRPNSKWGGVSSSSRTHGAVPRGAPTTHGAGEAVERLIVYDQMRNRAAGQVCYRFSTQQHGQKMVRTGTKYSARLPAAGGRMLRVPASVRWVFVKGGTMPQASLFDLTSSMKKGPSTDRWDFIVSYSEKQLNEFLQKSYRDNRLVQNVKLQAHGKDPIYGKNYTVDYVINFNPPTIEFALGQPNVAVLLMPIGAGSTFSVTPDGDSKPARTGDFPTGLSVRAEVPLAAIAGDTKEVTKQGAVVTFAHGKTTDQHIVLHFKNQTGTRFGFQPVQNEDDLDPLLPKLTKHFQEEVDEIAYVLGGVNNKNQSGGDMAMTPKSFAFASTGDKDAGCLSLFIQTDESGNPQGASAPVFHPDGTQVPPVPTGYTASIILSQDLMVNTFIKKQLAPRGFTVSGESKDGSCTLELKKDTSVIAQGEKGSGFDGGNGYYYGGMRVSLQDHPVKLIITDGKAEVKWSGKMTSEWHRNVSGPHPKTFYGTVYADIALNKGAKGVDVSNTGITFPDFTFTNDDFKPNFSTKDCSFWERGNGCDDSVQPFYRNEMKFHMPEINVQLKGLNYFLETNLLEPSKTMINVDSSAGLHTPYDFLVVGHVANS